MTLKIFLVLALTALLGAVIFFLWVSRLTPVFAGKHRIIYSLLAVVLTAAVGFAIVCLAGSSDIGIIYWLLGGLYLLAGIIHLIVTHARYFRPRNKDDKVTAAEYLYATSVLLGSLVILSALIYFFRDDESFRYFPVLLSGGVFLLVILVMHTFQAALNIPAPVYTFWRYPSRPIDPPEPKEQEQLLVIGFELAKQSQDIKRTYFRARALADIKLGEMYYHFLEDYNELQSETPIQYREPNNQPQEWWFYVKEKWFLPARILDPMQDMKENRIKENTIIICERILPVQQS
jgi:hypothetical protein